MTLKILPLATLLGLAACELPPKNIGDTGDETGGDPSTTSDGSAGTGETTTSTTSTSTTSGPDTSTTSTATGSTTEGTLQCEDPLQWPGVGKECATDEDCALVFHQTDCCGSLAGIGVGADAADAFNATEAECAALFPPCGCAPGPTTAEDGGMTLDPSLIAVSCVDNLCQSEVIEPGPLQWYTTCGDPVCSGYTKPEGVPLCTPEQMEGDPCDAEGTTCDPVSDCNALLVCATKDPKQQEGGCPISRARFKTEIEYLRPADLEKHAADLRSLRLATYRYRDAPADAPARLGIILEDDEQGVWVDARHDRVDLYGYASLAVATLQVQQRQIEALQAEVDRLSARLEMSRTCEP